MDAASRGAAGPVGWVIRSLLIAGCIVAGFELFPLQIVEGQGGGDTSLGVFLSWLQYIIGFCGSLAALWMVVHQRWRRIMAISLVALYFLPLAYGYITQHHLVVLTYACYFAGKYLILVVLWRRELIAKVFLPLFAWYAFAYCIMLSGYPGFFIYTTSWWMQMAVWLMWIVPFPWLGWWIYLNIVVGKYTVSREVPAPSPSHAVLSASPNPAPSPSPLPQVVSIPPSEINGVAPSTSCPFCHEAITGGRCVFCGAWVCPICQTPNKPIEGICIHCGLPRSSLNIKKEE